MKKKILITGINGYIGQHLSKMLKDDYDVYGIDFVDEFTTNIQQGNIRYKHMPFMLHHHFDTIIHLAALVQVGESVRMPWEYYDTNINGTHNVLNSFSYDNFVFASTGAAVNPVTPYGLSKRVAEDVVREHCKNRNKSSTIFRFYNVIGSEGFVPTNPDGLFYNLIKAEQNGKFYLYGDDYNTPDGSCIRDYVHVNEICHALKTAIEIPSSQVENLGHGKGYSVKQMIRTYQQVNDCDFEVKVCPRREGDLESSVLDNVSPYMVELYSFEELMKK